MTQASDRLTIILHCISDVKIMCGISKDGKAFAFSGAWVKNKYWRSIKCRRREMKGREKT